MFTIKIHTHTHISLYTHTHKIDVYNYTRNGKHMDLLKTWQMHEVAENILLEKTKKCMDLYSSTFK